MPSLMRYQHQRIPVSLNRICPGLVGMDHVPTKEHDTFHVIHRVHHEFWFQCLIISGNHTVSALASGTVWLFS